MRRVYLLAGTLAIAGCVAPTIMASDPGLGPEPYKIGPVAVWIKPEPEVAYLCGLALKLPRGKVARGCYSPEAKAIISVADPYVLLHEFKHYFEGRFHE